VRLLCPSCRTPYEARDVDRNRLLQVIADLPEKITLHQAKGCDRCGHTGFKGRQAIFEVMSITESVRSGIVADKGAGALAQLARQEAYHPLLHHGYQKVLDGQTTLSEVLRVTSLF
jgi:type II secretory ATPase GspE/PulE/Tfp pilus assembly ATPase PilB-like protein